MRAPDAKGNRVELDGDERELIRSLILSDPDLVLDDDQVMRALIGTTAQGARNVVDLRDRLVERMETRLDKLMRANRSVIAAAYENVATTNQVHRAVLALIGAEDLGTFLRHLINDVPVMLGVEEARVCLEADVPEARPADELVSGLNGRVVILPESTVESYLAIGGTEGASVVLRPCPEEKEIVFGHVSPSRSEALLRLDIGGVTGLLAFGAADPERFGPDQGIDLLTFTARTVEMLLTRHLAGDPAK
ncbi:DUF484 family protein [Rhodobacteraceae bacterium NNCM2]|nr:DUF484 family protein [Coraliihabitans acroporae]